MVYKCLIIGGCHCIWPCPRTSCNIRERDGWDPRTDIELSDFKRSLTSLPEKLVWKSRPIRIKHALYTVPWNTTFSTFLKIGSPFIFNSIQRRRDFLVWLISCSLPHLFLCLDIGFAEFGFEHGPLCVEFRVAVNNKKTTACCWCQSTHS